MLYHRPTNSLLATTSGWWSTNDCTPTASSIFRIPLSPSGGRVASPPICNSIATNSQEIMSIDELPDGSILMNLASGTLPVYPHLLLRVDPVTLNTTPFASPSVGDLNGGYYCAAIGRAVVLDDAADVLRTYGSGGSGTGQVLATTHAVSPTTTGYSPQETMWRVERNGPACTGAVNLYGAGLAGTGSIVPTLSVAGCPRIGTSFTVAANQLLGGSIGVLIAGSPASIPAFGGTLLVFPIQATILLAASGAPGTPGVGIAGLPVQVQQPSLAGTSIWLQAAFLDAATPAGWSLTNGLQVVLGG